MGLFLEAMGPFVEPCCFGPFVRQSDYGAIIWAMLDRELLCWITLLWMTGTSFSSLYLVLTKWHQQGLSHQKCEKSLGFPLGLSLKVSQLEHTYR